MNGLGSIRVVSAIGVISLSGAFNEPILDF